MRTKADQNNFYLYNRSLTEKAKKLRDNMTKSEACLWKYVLKAKKMKGFSFRRQRPVLNYIADFLCEELMLIIEVDGISHQHEDALKYDRNRDKELRDVGFTVLRFDDGDVLHHINTVKSKIEEWIDQKDAPPPFFPASGGES